MYNIPYHKQDIKDKSFLVTGGAGFIGSNLVEYLLKFGARKVRCMDNFSTGFHENIRLFKDNPAFELFEADIRDFKDCKYAVSGIEYVSHQAALGSVPRSINDPLTSNEVNVGGFLNMLIAAKDEQVKRFVYAASSSTYGDHASLPKVEDKIGKPLSPYAVTKYVNELYAGVFSKVYGFHTIGLRYFNVFGPRQNIHGPYAAVIPLFIEAALNKQSPYINGDGETSRDFTFVENAVQANIKAMLSTEFFKNEIVVNIACGERATLNQLWQEIIQHAGIDTAPIYRPERKGDIKHSLADITKASRFIEYQPGIFLKEGLKVTLAWFKQMGNGI